VNGFVVSAITMGWAAIGTSALPNNMFTTAQFNDFSVYGNALNCQAPTEGSAVVIIPCGGTLRVGELCIIYYLMHFLLYNGPVYVLIEVSSLILISEYRTNLTHLTYYFIAFILVQLPTMQTRNGFLSTVKYALHPIQRYASPDHLPSTLAHMHSPLKLAHL
jgi:hypothetical protein